MAALRWLYSLARSVGRWLGRMVEYLRRDPEAVGAQQSLGPAPSLQDVLNAGPSAADMNIVGMADPIDAQDAATKAYVDTALGTGSFVVTDTDPGAIGAGRIWVDPTAQMGHPAGSWLRRNAANDGWDPYFLAIAADGTLTLHGNDTEDLILFNGDAKVVLAADGAVTITNGDSPTGTIVLAADGTVTAGPSGIFVLRPDLTYEINGAQWIEATAAGLLLHLPTADPVAAGALWADAGVVKVSAG